MKNAKCHFFNFVAFCVDCVKFSIKRNAVIATGDSHIVGYYLREENTKYSGYNFVKAHFLMLRLDKIIIGVIILFCKARYVHLLGGLESVNNG